MLVKPWTWIGHTLRKPKTTIVNQALRWNPQGHRKPGRPRNSWRRSVIQEGKQQDKTWGQIEKIAQDRRKWKSFVDDLCPGMDGRVCQVSQVFNSFKAWNSVCLK